MTDTVFAQASARGAAGVAVIRVSGPGAFEAGTALAGSLGAPRQAVLRWLRDPATGTRLDQAVVVGFSGPGRGKPHTNKRKYRCTMHNHQSPILNRCAGSALESTRPLCSNASLP